MNFLAVFLGGGFGALLRYFISIVLPKENAFIPYCTLVANILGCFIAGLIFAFLIYKTDFNSSLKNFLITGFCGGLTTFSTFSLEAVELVRQGYLMRASLYIFTSLCICIISVILGMLVVKKYV